MEKGVKGLLDFMGLCLKFVEGSLSDSELDEAYTFIRRQLEASKTVPGRTPEGSTDGPQPEPVSIFAPFREDIDVPEPINLNKKFESPSASRRDKVLALGELVGVIQKGSTATLSRVFECPRTLTRDIVTPVLENLSEIVPIQEIPDQLLLLKEDKEGSDVIIAGYASVEMVDRDKHLIPRSTLEKAFSGFMSRQGRRNINFAHTNVQVGEVLDNWTSDRTGKTYKSEVDDKGLFIVARVFSDTIIGTRVAKEIRAGALTGFSISGLASDVEEKKGHKLVNGLELYEITVCEIPANPGAHFKIVKSISLDQIINAFQKSLPIGWEVTVDPKATLPFGYHDKWLEQSLDMRIGKYPSINGLYSLELRPYYSVPTGVRITDYSCSLVGSVAQKGFSMNDADILIKHDKESPLGIAIYRAVSEALPQDLKKSANFIFDVQGPHGGLHSPLYYLCAKRIK